MSEQLPSEEKSYPQFKQVEPLCFGDISAQNDDVSWLLIMEIRGKYVTIEEASALRDWLNKVLP
jgi:hypothetical protein